MDYIGIVEHSMSDPMWGCSQLDLVQLLDAWHKSIHGDEGKSYWVATVGGMFQSQCGVMMDCLVALRQCGATRN